MQDKATTTGTYYLHLYLHCKWLYSAVATIHAVEDYTVHITPKFVLYISFQNYMLLINSDYREVNKTKLVTPDYELMGLTLYQGSQWHLISSQNN